MSNPSGPPPHGNPSPWARPADHTTPIPPGADPHPRRYTPPPSQPTPPVPPPPPSESATRQLPADGRGFEQPTTRIPGAAGPAAPPPARRRAGNWLRDPLALALVAITVVALTLAALIGSELFARRVADDKVAKATSCVVQDQASASFGVTPPFLWQHITGNYTNISIRTAGNQIKDAKEMQAELSISDVRLHSDANSSGTIGALDATLTWPTSGIKDTIQQMVPVLGSLVSDVSTNPGAGTVELRGAFGLASVSVKPQVVNGGLSLQVQNLTGLGSLALPRETIQPTLDDFATQLTKKYPLGIHADSVQVTDSGVVAHFSTRNATIPPHSQDPCFAHL